MDVRDDDIFLVRLDATGPLADHSAVRLCNLAAEMTRKLGD